MLRPPRESDICRLAEIHVCAWRYAYRGIISDQELFVDRQVVIGMKLFESVISDKPESLVVWDDGIIKGFALHGKCRDSDCPNAYEIMAIYLQPEFVRQGIGTQMVRFVENQAQALAYDCLKIWVLEKNLIGVGFYRKCGFEPELLAKNYDNASEKEIRYTKKL